MRSTELRAKPRPQPRNSRYDKCQEGKCVRITYSQLSVGFFTDSRQAERSSNRNRQLREPPQSQRLTTSLECKHMPLENA